MRQGFACAAVELGQIVDATLNGAARAEEDAAMQDGGLAVSEHGVFLDDREPTFTPQTRTCVECRGQAELKANGSIKTDVCEGAESCVVVAAEMHPEDYADDTSERHVPCRALKCGALIGISIVNGGAATRAVAGTCSLDTHAAGMAATRKRSLDKMPHWREIRDLWPDRFECPGDGRILPGADL